MDNTKGTEIVPTAIASIAKRRPKEVLEEAAVVAKALTKWMKDKRNPVIFNEEQYPEFEDWQLCGQFYGITTRIVWARPVEFGDVRGFEARAEAVDREGNVLSAAESMCLNDEEKWSVRTKYGFCYVCKDGSVSADDPGPGAIVWEPNPKKPGKMRPKKTRVAIGEEKVPLFQLKSMAQTRAAAKSLRNILSWVFVLAGFEPQIAEEFTGTEFGPERSENEPEVDDANVKRNPPKGVPLKTDPAGTAGAPAHGNGWQSAGESRPTPPMREPGQDDDEPPAGRSAKGELFDLLRKTYGNDQAMLRENLKRLTSYDNPKTGRKSAGKDSIDMVSEKEAQIALADLRRQIGG
jgi:hypothetical protein